MAILCPKGYIVGIMRDIVSSLLSTSSVRSSCTSISNKDWAPSVELEQIFKQ